MNTRLYVTLGGFSLLVALAALTLDGDLRLATLIFLGALIAKTCLAAAARR